MNLCFLKYNYGIVGKIKVKSLFYVIWKLIMI